MRTFTPRVRRASRRFYRPMVGGRAHVLVSSRPYPELPSDVPVGHPLLSTPQTELEPFEGAAELAALARQEIDELKRRDDDGLATRRSRSPHRRRRAAARRGPRAP